MKLFSKTLSAAVLALATSATMNTAHAELSANAGFVSEYYFRGAVLGDAGAYAGADYEKGGFYAGTWWIDDGGNATEDGLETDFYFGYGFDLDAISFGVGYTRYEYTYTSDFEHEVNLTAGFGPFGFEYTIGEDDDDGSSETDYDFIALTWSGEVFGLTLGSFENDDTEDAYDYIELSATTDVAGLSASFSVGQTSNVETSGADAESGDGYMFVDISKSFDL